MSLHPQAQAIVDFLASLQMPDISTLDPNDARQGGLPRGDNVQELPKVEDLTVPSSDGSHQIPVRAYYPVADAKDLPVIVYFHGGGWVIGDIDGHDGFCRVLSHKLGLLVLSVDYRLAPENKFPVPLQDCYDVTAWAADNAASLGGDPKNLFIGGDSAGGNLAACVALKARDESGPAVKGQVLYYPVTEMDFDNGSYTDNATGYLLTRDGMKYFWGHYLNDASDAQNPYAAPMVADDLSGLPPAIVITAEFDPLRDEGEKYGAALNAAGVPATVKRFDGQIHAFMTMVDMIDDAHVGLQDTHDFVQGLMG